MTEDKLDHLFESARNARIETSQEEVTRWLGTAAVAAVSAGAAATGFKLLLTKNMIAMIAGTLSVAGIAVVSTGIFSPTDHAPISQNQHVVTYVDSNKNNMDSETTFYSKNVILDPVSENGLSNLEPGNELNVEGPLSPLFTWDATNMAPTNNRACQPVEIQQPWVTEGRTDTAKANGQAFTVKPFNKLHIDGVFQVIVLQGSEEKVSVEGDESGCVRLEHDGDLLIVTSNGIEDKGRKCRDMEDVVVYITVKNLSYLNVTGVGNVIVEDMKTPELRVDFDGVGDLIMHLTCEKFDIVSSGVGNIQLEGESGSANYDYSGVGDIYAYNFKVHDVMVHSSAIGSLFVFADNTLSIEANGVGDITYTGGADLKGLNFSGIGTLRSE